MSLSTQPYKGARDFYPEDFREQGYIFSIWRQICQSYGYEEYTAPIIEPTDLYESKTSTEIVNDQTYTFKDRGDRSVTIRPEMTPTVSRMVTGRRQELAYPVRWFSIPNLWRYERPQRGRLREHWQLNVDIFGDETINAELELMEIAWSIMTKFSHVPSEDIQFKINDRRIVDRFYKSVLNLSQEKIAQVTRLVDRKDKLTELNFKKVFIELTDAETYGKFRLYESSDKQQEMLKHESAEDLNELLQKLANKDIRSYFDLFMVRGFEYYTGIVFELFDLRPENNRSLLGGGRYDGLVAEFGVNSVPTVGFGMGDVTALNFLDSRGGVNPIYDEVKKQKVIRVIPVDQSVLQDPKFNALIFAMRNEHDLNLAIDMTKAKLDRKVRQAFKSSAEYILVVGPDELRSEEYIFKKVSTSEKLSLQPKNFGYLRNQE